MVERPDMFGVQAAPNECIVRGPVNNVSHTTEGRILELKVEETEDVEGMRNFARTRVGEEIKVFIPPGEAKGFSKGDRIEAHVSFEGDAHGGMFFLKEKGARKL